ncbi:hypothetical protein OBP_046 [Pseudomonas phage OBP]|uniref:hypothetical protein n=1 Tax=Pseudomonas phage OBP TaxID=1124849 RepID=UPI000240D62B|nr:hypothetical protein OBP_046 [Pseudomonas phage OBP]AEV89483.1 hypothetical protein OBP_046 [Pseudomonas phage OBP]
MSQTQAIIDFATLKVTGICTELKGKQIPNWWKMGDVQGFGFKVTEGELNFQIGAAIYPVEEAGEGNFLIKMNSCFLSNPVRKQGYELLQVPLGAVLELDFPIYAEHEQELMDGVLQLISDEAENILCRILQ